MCTSATLCICVCVCVVCVYAHVRACVWVCMCICECVHVFSGGESKLGLVRPDYMASAGARAYKGLWALPQKCIRARPLAGSLRSEFPRKLKIFCN